MTVVIPTGARVIDIDLDTAETNIFKNVPYNTNEMFYSTDIGMAFLKFTGATQDYTGCTARLTLINFNDGSKVQRTFEMDTTTTFVYPMLETELAHAGRWIGQLTVIKGGTTISDNPFRFKIDGTILTTALIGFDNINIFTSQLATIYDGLNTFLDVVILDESGRTDAEGLRVVAEGLRVTAEALRETKEGLRQTTFEANEITRDGLVSTLIASGTIEQAVIQEVAQQYQLIESTQAPRLLSVEQQLSQAELNKVDKGGAEQVTFAMLSQDAKMAMTGGGVAVVGVDGVSKANTVPNSVTKNKLSAELQNMFFEAFTVRAMTFADLGYYTMDGVLNTIAGYHKEAIPVTPGDIYRVSGYAGPYMSLFILAKSDGVGVSKYPAVDDTVMVYYDNVLVTIPNNVSFLHINIKDSNLVAAKVEVANGHLLDGTRVKNREIVEGKQLYDLSQNVTGKWLSSTGVISVNTTSKYAKIPVEAGQKVSLCRKDTRSFSSAQSGSLVYFDNAGNVLSYVDPLTLVNPTLYNTFNYITFTVPVGCVAIGYTTKLNTTYDITALLLVVYGDKITDAILTLNSLIYLNGAEIKDKTARDSIALLSGDVSAKPYEGIKWVVVGDSLTEVNTRTTLHYHDYIAEELGFTVVNMGLGGSGYKRKFDTTQAFYQRVLTIPADADVVTVFGSFNDIGGGYALGTAADTGETTICGCINTFFDNYYSMLPITPIGIILPTPWVGNYPGVTNADNYVNALIEICKKRSVPYLDLYRGSNLRPWDAEFRTLAYSKDDGNGVHPDETGHKIFYPSTREFVKALI